MAKNKKVEISLEEKLEKALVPIDEQPYKLPDSWVWTKYDVLFSDISKNDKKIEEKYYLENGEIAIVSQGKDEIAGYSNILDIKPYKEELPLIIFGDHTLNVKYIDFPFFIGADGVKVLKTTNIIIPKLLFYLLNNLKTFSLINTGYRRHYPILKKLFFPLPPLNEQKRIVEKLDFLFDKIKKAKEIIEEIKIDIENRKISILDRAYKGILSSKWRNENKTSDVKELLKTINDEKIKKWEEECLQAEKEGKKKPKKPTITEIEDMIVPVDEQPYKLPDNWVWVRLGDIIDNIKYGYTASSQENGEVKLLRITDIQNDEVNWNTVPYCKISEEEFETYQLKVRDILIARTGGTIGKTFLIREIPKNLKSVYASYLIKFYPNKNISEIYLKNYFSTDLYWKLLKMKSRGTGQPNVNSPSLQALLVPLPPLEEQQEVVRILDEVLENENKVKELLELEERIDVLEKSILNKAFKGELGTQNSSDEPAIKLLKEIL
ncbi:restriction endonuclease subunit S [Fusobacterium hwasookii]|jgi:hypothetical protein|uniref:Restriction modification system DNA specificity domain-containing protein n=2 Tax=Fusobacterium TaxID=848 RepID=A0ABN0GYQ7_9FUSO|nr:restriction endonuclease subunit S [Fusobacterium hwasookii]EJU07069.1 restriction modification system DNA specificity domain-containing protein [Fusobacterium hwasookii ChDC F128]